MTYSIDLRKRAVSYVRDGGSRLDACRLFNIDRKTLYHWLKREDLSPKGRPGGGYKLNKASLYRHVQENPDAFLRERAEYFGVKPHTIYYALKRMGIVKKND